MLIYLCGRACICSSLSLYYRTLLDQDVTYTVVRIQILMSVDSESPCLEANRYQLSSIVELCVGIYITCIPATSVFMRHILPSVTSLPLKITYYSSKLHGSTPVRQAQAPNGSNIHKSGTSRNNGPYRNLRDRQLVVNDDGAYDLALYAAPNVKTTVVAEPFEALSDDRIHLRVDLEQG